MEEENNERKMEEKKCKERGDWSADMREPHSALVTVMRGVAGTKSG